MPTIRRDALVCKPSPPSLSLWRKVEFSRCRPVSLSALDSTRVLPPLVACVPALSAVVFVVALLLLLLLLLLFGVVSFYPPRDQSR